MSFKAKGEIEWIFETDLFRDEVDGFLGEFEELPRTKQTLLFKIALRSFSGLGAKEMGKARWREAATSGDLSHGEWLGEMCTDKIHGGANPTVEMGGFTLGVGAIASQDDFLERVHTEFLAQAVGAGVEL